MFGNLRKEASESADRTVSDQVMEYWTNFAKTGNPNGGSLAAWPRYDVKSGGYLEFTGSGPVVKNRLRKPFCDLFIQNLKLPNQ